MSTQEKCKWHKDLPDGHGYACPHCNTQRPSKVDWANNSIQPTIEEKLKILAEHFVQCYEQQKVVNITAVEKILNEIYTLGTQDAIEKYGHELLDFIHGKPFEIDVLRFMEKLREESLTEQEK